MKKVLLIILGVLVILFGILFSYAMIDIASDTPPKLSVETILETCKDFINYDISAEECKDVLEKTDYYYWISKLKEDDKVKKFYEEMILGTKDRLVAELDKVMTCSSFDEELPYREEFFNIYYDLEKDFSK